MTTRREVSSQRTARDIDTMRSHGLMGILVVAIVVLGLGAWAGFAKLSGAVIAPGTVVVDSYVKKVQHPSGGVVGEIHVRDGDTVSAGDLLIRLDETTTRANLQIVVGQLNELMIRAARLQAERDDADGMALPTVLAARAHESKIAEILHGERVLLETRRRALEGQKAQLDERVSQLGEEIRGLVAQQEAKQREIRLIRDELKGLAELQKKNLVPSIKIMSLEREAARLEGERGQLIAAAAQAKGKIAETRLQAVQLDRDLRAEVIGELREIDAKVAELSERRVAAEDQLRRIEIKSPQAGVVHQLAVHTIGGVIEPGETLMLIVPDGDTLVVEAKIAPQDIDNIEAGQPAYVRLTALNANLTPAVEATVARVAADLTRDPELNQAYYLARLDLPSEVLDGRGPVRLVPGMPAEVHVQTGARTLLSYLMKPLTDQYARAFTEQ